MPMMVGLMAKNLSSVEPDSSKPTIWQSWNTDQPSSNSCQKVRYPNVVDGVMTWL